ncbi:hypothetical protein BJF90_15070 [Pseudonocardia sp. CNS-004]|nr:hypothetical protein BJF90_15070 [Pseudonocardia sp. CNS-004]
MTVTTISATVRPSAASDRELEATSPHNRRRYARHGFEVIGEITLSEALHQREGTGHQAPIAMPATRPRSGSPPVSGPSSSPTPIM